MFISALTLANEIIQLSDSEILALSGIAEKLPSIFKPEVLLLVRTIEKRVVEAGVVLEVLSSTGHPDILEEQEPCPEQEPWPEPKPEVQLEPQPEPEPVAGPAKPVKPTPVPAPKVRSHIDVTQPPPNYPRPTTVVGPVERIPSPTPAPEPPVKSEHWSATWKPTTILDTPEAKVEKAVRSLEKVAQVTEELRREPLTALEVANLDPTRLGLPLQGWVTMPCLEPRCGAKFLFPQETKGRRPEYCMRHIKKVVREKRVKTIETAIETFGMPFTDAEIAEKLTR